MRRTVWNNTALHTAITSDHTDCVELLIREGADVNYIGSLGETPLTVASKNPDASSMKILIEAGADVNMQNTSGNSALNTCILFRNGDEQVVVDKIRLLLKAGAHINRKANTGQPAQYVDVSWKTLIRILFAAGEILPFHSISAEGDSLKDLCRRRIRQILIDKDPHENLFVRIPQLGLPSLVTEYLSYGVTLNDNNAIP